MKKRLSFEWVVAAAILALSLCSCGMPPRYVIQDKDQVDKLNDAWAKRKEFPQLQKMDYQTPLYARYLEGVKICLDPGHGGDAARPRYKRGPTDYREAIMNWKVANYLKDFLEGSGAIVKLTREGDEDVSLADRVRIANEWGADLFISLHHNAAGPSVNRNTVWFHGNPDDCPSNLDFARYIQQGVADALRLPQVDGAPLKSDYLMYDTGFGVLRGLKMTACLCEASFFTHPYEEYRLKKDSYLKRQAYGYFLGLARYAWRGIPKAVLVSPPVGEAVATKTPTLELKTLTGFGDRPYWAADRAWVFSDSIRVSVDGKPVPASFDKERGVITAKVKEPLSTGKHVVMGGFRNYNGNYAHPIEQEFIVDPPVHKIVLSATSEPIPSSDRVQVGIRAEVLDRDGEKVLDGTVVHFAASQGALRDIEATTREGIAVTLLELPAQAKSARVFAVSEGRFGGIQVGLK